MALAVYVKDDPILRTQITKKKDRTFFGLMIILGLASIIFSIWPYLVWQLKTLPRLSGEIDQVPIPQSQVLFQTTLSNSVQVAQDPDGFSYFVTSVKSEDPRPKEFKVTIPKLKITEAIVRVDSLNFYDSLAHFPGSALPGEVGNSFITGHSILPQFYDPANYRAIFSKLSDLEVGDDIYVEIEGRNLRFVVQYAKVVDPRDTSVLAPISQNGRNLTLMTCVPPGTNLKRLVVITSLI